MITAATSITIIIMITVLILPLLLCVLQEYNHFNLREKISGEINTGILQNGALIICLMFYIRRRFMHKALTRRNLWMILIYILKQRYPAMRSAERGERRHKVSFWIYIRLTSVFHARIFCENVRMLASGLTALTHAAWWRMRAEYIGKHACKTVHTRCMPRVRHSRGWLSPHHPHVTFASCSRATTVPRMAININGTLFVPVPR